MTHSLIDTAETPFAGRLWLRAKRLLPPWL